MNFHAPLRDVQSTDVVYLPLFAIWLPQNTFRCDDFLASHSDHVLIASMRFAKPHAVLPTFVALTLFRLCQPIGTAHLGVLLWFLLAHFLCGFGAMGLLCGLLHYLVQSGVRP